MQRLGKGEEIDGQAVPVIKDEYAAGCPGICFGDGKLRAGGEEEGVFFKHSARPAEQVFPAAKQRKMIAAELPAFLICDRRPDVLHGTIRRCDAVAAEGIINQLRFADMVGQGEETPGPGFLYEVFPQPFCGDVVGVFCQYTFCHGWFSFNFFIICKTDSALRAMILYHYDNMRTNVCQYHHGIFFKK